MSSNSLAALRRSAGDEFKSLADQHLQHDLNQSDRDTLESAAKSFTTYTGVGTGIGLALGLFLAFRVRSARKRMFDVFRAQEKPTQVMFANGRTEPIPDLTPMLKPTTLGDVASYIFFGAGGLFLFGELGGLAGAYSATNTISKDPESRRRIESAFRNFRADVLRKEADMLQRGNSAVGF